ncbi:MAG: WYL domain-containing protein [Flavobacteriaceae bacterium]|nr:WYL domain-containing protein [Flavobacteriaceae bacterium]
MPINKNALIRYHALDKCFSNPGRNFDINALLEAVNEVLFEHNQNSIGIQKRQLYDDIRFMQSSQGYAIELEKIRSGQRVFYRYKNSGFSINNNPINELEAEKLKSAMMVLKRFKGMPQFKWVNELLPKMDQAFSLKGNSEGTMSFENNPYLKGLDFLDPLFNAILYQKALEITYKPFDKEPYTVPFFPYHLKQFNSRWFLFGRNPAYDNLTNFPLDRIFKLNELDIPYEGSQINFEEYFDDVIGVTINQSIPEIIEIKVTKRLWHYISTKPIHGSQTKKKSQSTFTIFSLEVIPNLELEKLILSFGEEMEILSPIHFRKKIKTRLKKNIEQYE